MLLWVTMTIAIGQEISELGPTVSEMGPVIPAASVAGEGGPGMLWVNPALQAYDRDFRYGVFVSLDEPGARTPLSVAATVGTDGLGVGIHSLRRPDGQTDWALDYATSLRFPKRISAGFSFRWNLVGGGRNYVAYNGGIAWRPLPWLGVGGAARNIGSPDPRELADPISSVGVAIRPFQRGLVLSLDYAHVFDQADPRDLIRANVRVRPTSGLYLRAGVDTQLNVDGVQLANIGAGLELYFGGRGVGSFTATDFDSYGVTTWFGSDEPGESLLPRTRQVALVRVDSAPSYEPKTGLLGQRTTENTWLETLELLRRLEREKGEIGLVITLGEASLSWGRYRELRDRVDALEASGKPVIAYLYGNPNNGAYYVASAASRVLMHPSADLNLVGLSAELMYLRGLFDLVGVEPQFERRAEYKSAAESFTDLEPSAATLEMNEALLDDLFEEMVSQISAGRSVEPSEVDVWVDSGPWTASDAMERGLIDGLTYPDELEDALVKLHEGKVTTHMLDTLPQPHSSWEEPSQIAVIYIDGPIVTGESSGAGLFGLGARTAGSKTVVRQLGRAMRDPQVRAVVLRVDSPGGSAFASDEIHHAVERLRREGKPVVVTMGGVAASGGYYVACGADAIWAEPNTITGSIGVYSGKFATRTLFENMGINVTTLTRGNNANMYSTTDPWGSVQQERVSYLVDDIYRQFKAKVADGRGLSEEEVEAVARGRVWSGSAASENGLVDQLGGLPEAIEDARIRAGIPEGRSVALVGYSRTGTLQLPGLSPSIPGTKVVLGENPTHLQKLQAMSLPDSVITPIPEKFAPLWTLASSPDDVWMMLPYSLEVTPR